MEQEVIEFFNSVNKGECYLHRIKVDNPKKYFELKNESAMLEYDDLDQVIYDCVFTEDPKLVRHVLNSIDVSDIESNFDFALKRIDGLRLRFWRDLFRGDVEIDSEKHLLYLNYFTLFAGRTGGDVNTKFLNDFDYLEGQFMREKLLAKLLEFGRNNVNNNYIIDIIRVGDMQKIVLEQSNSYLERRIATLGGSEFEQK